MSSKAPGADTDLLPAYSPTHSESEQHHAHYPFISSTITTLQESRTFWLSLYFCFNLSLTLYNKSVLVRFPFPYTLTAIHALFGTIGGTALVRCGVYVPVKLKPSETAVLAAFSVLYAFNIVVSNASLQLVTVAFHQVIRSSTPIFTIFFCAVLLGKHTSRAKMVSLSPVVFGVCLATYGDYYFTRLGFFLTLLGTVLAALKTIFTSVLQSPPPSATSTSPTTRSSITFKISGFHWGVVPFPRLHPLDLLHLLSPLAFIQCVLLAYFSGELDRVRVFAAQEMTPFKVTALSMNGCLAFGLNVVSFSANKRVGPVGMTVAANVKQVLTMLCAVVVFNLTITPANGLGIILTLVGGAWYAYVEYEEKREVPEAKWVETEK